MAKYTTGDLISFHYNKLGARDKRPLVVVIAPFYNGMLHGINVNYLKSPVERDLLLSIIDEDHRKVSEILPINVSLDNLLKRGNIKFDIKVPQLFYERYIKPMLKSNAYRMYDPKMIGTLRVLTDKKKILIQ